jgi:hypothetical protein
MSLIIYPTEDYNSWISEEDADTYFETRLYNEDWTQATGDLKPMALVTAFRSMEELNLNLEDLESTDQEEVDNLLTALQRASCEQALHELKHDLEEQVVKSVSLGGLLSASMMSGPEAVPERFSSRALSVLAPYRTVRMISRVR